MRNTYRALYRLGLRPWDSAEVPGPVVRVARAVATPGIAVDLGCGTGTQARYLAGLGWSVTAVDYLAEPITLARRRDPAGVVSWLVADATRADQVDPAGSLAGRVGLLLDNGCLHGIPDAGRPGWARR